MISLKIIIASTRPGRKGLPVANWFMEMACKHEAFHCELIDLAVVNLPFMDEPNHPMLQKYEHQHTIAWSKTIDSADAFVIVTPEYNHCFPATIKNALDYLHKEWSYKPVGFVSYGGVSGGMRAVHSLKPIVSTLKMVPVTEGVIIPFVGKLVDEHGHFNSNELLEKAAGDMLKEIERWAVALKAMRGPSPALPRG